MQDPLARLRQFVSTATILVSGSSPDSVDAVRAALANLIAEDDWLPEAFARPDPDRYTQYLLHCDPLERFSVVSFVWGPGQATPLHDHRVWGLVGMLRGSEIETRYARDDHGRLTELGSTTLCRGDVAVLRPDEDDIHVVRNAFPDRVSVSIHVYGGNIGAINRAVYDPISGVRKPFVSGYANDALPNLWNRAAEAGSDITPVSVRSLLQAGSELALLDLREEGPYSREHPLFAVNLPLSRIELALLDLIPRRDVLVVLYDDGDGALVQRARRILAALGYTDVRALSGGLRGWRLSGGELFSDVNVPGKAFGEMVEVTRHTPSIPAGELRKRLDAGEDLVVLDARRFEEYAVMSIPAGRSVPGGELALRVRDVAPDPATTVVVNCAGRTRSIIGTQSLINAGIPNPVFALRNGTIGWNLAGLALDQGADRRAGPATPAAHQAALASAKELARRTGVRMIRPEALAALRLRPDVTLYCLDVRTPEEHRAGHPEGFRSAPGGQLVQATDEWVGVRHATLVLADDDGVRARMAGHWLAQMGWREVYVLESWQGLAVAEGEAAPDRPALPTGLETIQPAALEALLGGSLPPLVVDLALSPAFRRGHVPGAVFAIRAELAAALRHAGDRRIVLTSDDGVLASYAASDLRGGSAGAALLLAGGTRAWSEAGYGLATGLAAHERLSEPDDVYKRPYEGTDNAVQAMQAYLDWEAGLVDQLARDGTHGFRVMEGLS